MHDYTNAIKKIQGLFENLKHPDKIGFALKIYPKVIAAAATAVRQAASDPGLSQTDAVFASAPNTHFNSSLQLIRMHLSDSQLWVQSGFSRQQLLSIADSFANAEEDVFRRIEQDRNKTAEKKRENEFARQRHIQKRTRHIRKD